MRVGRLAVAATVLGAGGSVVADDGPGVAGARRHGFRLAQAHFADVDPARLWLLSTDADSVVPESWVDDVLLADFPAARDAVKGAIDTGVDVGVKATNDLAERAKDKVNEVIDNAAAVAKWLVGHPQIAWVSYPGLPGDRYQALAQKYVPKGAGSVFTFGLKGGYDAGVKLVSNVTLFSHLANIGDTRSLIIHPASTTHRQLTDEQKTVAGAGPDVVRLSIGLEDKEDIIADLEQGLAEA